MESSGICRAVERFNNIPALSIRAISNLLDEKGHDRGTPANGMTICSQRLAEFVLPLLPMILDNKQAFHCHHTINKYQSLFQLVQNPEAPAQMTEFTP